jgi:hypothetical protein
MLILKPQPNESVVSLLNRFKFKTQDIILEAKTKSRFLSERDKFKIKQRRRLNERRNYQRID